VKVLSHRFVVKDTHRQCPRQTHQSFRQRDVAGIVSEHPETFSEQEGHFDAAARDLAEGRAQKVLGDKWVFARLVFDDRSAHLAGGEPVRETGGDERPCADSDIDGDPVEVDPIEGLIKGSNGPDFVDRAGRSAPGQRKTDDSLSPAILDHG